VRLCKPSVKPQTRDVEISSLSLELAASPVLDHSARAHNIRPLERDGLVEVVADEHDKRNRLVALTEAGWAKLAQSQPLWEEAQRRFERAFGEEKARAFRATFD